LRCTSFLFALLCLVLLCAQPALADSLTDAETAIGRRDYVSALNILRPLAEQGDATAQFQLGHLWATGSGVPQDNAEAAKWYLSAAVRGYVRAQATAGEMYAEGKGVQRDPAEAVRWYRKAAERMCAPAMVALGVMYAEGKGVRKDQAEALRWWQQAANIGDLRARDLIRKARAQANGAPLLPADEVRTLASRTQSSTDEITSGAISSGKTLRRPQSGSALRQKPA